MAKVRVAINVPIAKQLGLPEGYLMVREGQEIDPLPSYAGD